MGISTLFQQINFGKLQHLFPNKQQVRGRKKKNKPFSLFQAIIVMILLGKNYEEISNFFKRDEYWQRLCEIVPVDKSQYCRFVNSLGENILLEIKKFLVLELIRIGIVNGKSLAIDSTLSSANPKDKDGKFGVKMKKVGNKMKEVYVFGYKITLIVDTYSELPLEFTINSANVSDFKCFIPVIMVLLNNLNLKFETIIADKGYDSNGLRNFVRDCDAEPIIKYRKHRRIRTKESNEFKKKYKPRTSIERVFSRMKYFINRFLVNGIVKVKRLVLLLIISILFFALFCYHKKRIDKFRSRKFFRNLVE